MLIAWKNIMARKWSSTKVALSILAMVVVMCVFTAYSIALADETERVIKSYRSAHNIIIESSAPIDKDKILEAEQINGIQSVTQVAICRNFENLIGMKFVVNGKQYECEHSNYYEGDWTDSIESDIMKLHYGDFAFVKSGKGIVSPHQDEELGYRFKGQKTLLVGKDSVIGNEIIVSEQFLLEFGLDANILDKNLSIFIDGRQFDMKVVGILNSLSYDLTNTLEQHFIASLDSNIFSNYFKANEKNTSYQTKLYLKDYKLNSKILDSVNKIFTTNAKSIYFGDQLGLSMATTANIIASILDGVMATIGLGIISALVLNILYSMRFMIKKKNNFYAIMQVYGMDKKKLFNILFCEMFILSMFAAVFAYGISYGLVYLLDFLMSSMVGIGVFFGWANFLITFVIAVIFTLLIVVLTCVINYSLYYKRSTTKMLRNTIEN